MHLASALGLTSRRSILGVPVGRTRLDLGRAIGTHAVGRAAGVGVAGMSVATAGYVSWSLVRAATSVRDAVGSAADMVQHGAQTVDRSVAKVAGENDGSSKPSHAGGRAKAVRERRHAR
ncbi:hypothetical protein [Egicoccus halophilus]|uniref:Uncharacterized protein n=1 Tax=Egicoccus halophilus TaxID=1670830 RepID=A0A8J3ETS9_9ACTN|nr:hypothetical protein [Egicoccus halophilus]GGI04533.1 hypothetical protein GCM10011354_09570 [Egicoccus halophilus]